MRIVVVVAVVFETTSTVLTKTRTSTATSRSSSSCRLSRGGYYWAWPRKAMEEAPPPSPPPADTYSVSFVPVAEAGECWEGAVAEVAVGKEL